jgi:hypothetical protein
MIEKRLIYKIIDYRVNCWLDATFNKLKLLKKYIIKVLTDIKYKVNITIANQNDERDVCTTCRKNQADEKS